MGGCVAPCVASFGPACGINRRRIRARPNEEVEPFQSRGFEPFQSQDGRPMDAFESQRQAQMQQWQARLQAPLHQHQHHQHWGCNVDEHHQHWTWTMFFARSVLRSTHSFVSLWLYALFTWVFVPVENVHVPCMVHFFRQDFCPDFLIRPAYIGIMLVLPYTFAYRFFSRNVAGSYYNTELTAFMSFPAHASRKWARLCSDRRFAVRFREQTALEHRYFIFRNVNMWESGTIYLIVYGASEIFECLGNHGFHHVEREWGKRSFEWRVYEGLVLFAMHRIYAMNLFQQCLRGLIQPEGMWMFSEQELSDRRLPYDVLQWLMRVLHRCESRLAGKQHEQNLYLYPCLSRPPQVY